MQVSPERIVELLNAADKTGLAMAELEDRLGANRRTILRYLNQLIDDGIVRRTGGGRSTRYVARASIATAHDAKPEFSTEAQEALRQVQRPVRARHPVGYEPGFLLDYEPNATFYLDAHMRERLRQVGSLGSGPMPAGTYARRILDRLLIDLSWNSSRLEGNTYSLLETERLLAAGIEAESRDPLETQMILNHKFAIEFLVETAEEAAFDRLTILNLHALLSDNLLQNPADGGRLRTSSVGITGSVFEPLQNPHRIEEYFDALVAKAAAVADPLEQCLFTLVQLPYLQPFIDVNKRVSRLAANIPLMIENLCPLSFVDVEPRDYAIAMLAVYEQNDIAPIRDLFAWAYQRSAARYGAIRQSLGEPDPFKLRYREQLKHIVGELIRQRIPTHHATGLIEEFAASIAAEDRQQFVAVTLAELETIHEGNFRRFPVRPSQFRAWSEENRKEQESIDG